MKLDKNICFRIDRDARQISRCKSFIAQRGAAIDRESKKYNLMGNPVRLAILNLLLEEQKLCVCDLSEILEMKIPAVSQHLRKLKDGGLVQATRAGTVIFYQITESFLPVLNIMLETVPQKVSK